MSDHRATKELYQRFRAMSWEQLWEEEAPRFNAASAKERAEQVTLVRAVGVVFSESGNPAQTIEVKEWLRKLLHDPAEKIRRYAMAALPKIGAGQSEEADLLAVLKTTSVEREKKFAAQALEKIGGAATLETLQDGGLGLSAQTERKIKASMAREQSPSAVRTGGVLSEFEGVRIHLRGRRGLEGIVRREVEQLIAAHGKFRLADVRDGLVVLIPLSAFSLADLYALRCFSTVGFAVGRANSIDGLAAVMTSLLSRRIWQAFTDGAIRYRLNFIAKGHQRSAVRLLADKVYALCPEILNDGRDVTWTVDVYPGGGGDAIELRPNVTPDPRFYYRQRDVPAASHPQLAACMALAVGRMKDEIVWDPFCGSGSELVESALLGGVKTIHGTDLSGEAIGIAQRNLAAARVKPVPAKFVRSDFRDYARDRLGPNSVTLIITNPPLGMRVPVPNLRGLMADLLGVAATVLKPDGRLIFANPIASIAAPPSLKLQLRQSVDFGGFDCRLEIYEKRK